MIFHFFLFHFFTFSREHHIIPVIITHNHGKTTTIKNGTSSTNPSDAKYKYILVDIIAIIKNEINAKITAGFVDFFRSLSTIVIICLCFEIRLRIYVSF